MGKWAHLRAENDLFKFEVTKGLAFGILGLNHAIGVQEQSVTGTEFEVANRIVGFTRHTENQAVAFDSLSGFQAGEEERRMPCG